MRFFSLKFNEYMRENPTIRFPALVSSDLFGFLTCPGAFLCFVCIVPEGRAFTTVSQKLGGLGPITPGGGLPMMRCLLCLDYGKNIPPKAGPCARPRRL